MDGARVSGNQPHPSEFRLPSKHLRRHYSPSAAKGSGAAGAFLLISRWIHTDFTLAAYSLRDTRGSEMPHQSRDVVCQNCDHSIELPSNMRQRAPRLWLACPSCGHVYDYELQRYLVGWRQSRDSRGLILRSIACECSDSNCKFPVSIHTILSAGIDAEAELATRSAQWVFHGATCPFGHPVGGPQRSKIA